MIMTSSPQDRIFNTPIFIVIFRAHLTNWKIFRSAILSFFGAFLPLGGERRGLAVLVDCLNKPNNSFYSKASQIQNFTIVSVAHRPSFSCRCVSVLPGQTHKYTGWNCNKRWSYKKFSNSWRKNRRAFLTWPKNIW